MCSLVSPSQALVSLVALEEMVVAALLLQHFQVLAQVHQASQTHLGEGEGKGVRRGKRGREGRGQYFTYDSQEAYIILRVWFRLS